MIILYYFTFLPQSLQTFWLFYINQYLVLLVFLILFILLDMEGYFIVFFVLNDYWCWMLFQVLTSRSHVFSVKYLFNKFAHRNLSYSYLNAKLL